MTGKNVLPAIKEFPDDGRAWRVDWLGGIQRNVAIADEPTIQVVISPLEVSNNSSPKDLASVSAVSHKEQTIINVGVGQLPYLQIGSIWQKKRRQQNTAGTLKTASLNVAPSTVALLRANREVDDDRLIPGKYHRFGVGTDSFCLTIQNDGDPHGIIIPAVEVLRFYYATSSNLSRALFTGAFIHDQDELINTAKSGVDPTVSRAWLCLRPKTLDVDSWIIARILFAKEAFSCVSDVYTSLTRQSAQGKTMLFPPAAFPFTGTSILRLRGKPIKTAGGKWRFLTFAIEHCTAPFPVERLLRARDNDGTTPGNGAMDLPDEKKLPAYPLKNKADLKEWEGLFQSVEEASKAIATISFSQLEDRFGYLQHRPLEKITKDRCNYINARKLGDNAENFSGLLSTGAGGYGGGSIAPAVIQTRQRAKGLPADLEIFEKVIQHIDALPYYHAVIRDPSPEIAAMPLTKGSGKRQWSYLDSKKRLLRVVVVGDIFRKGRACSAIEFQHAEGEHFKLGLLYRTDGESLSDVELGWILKKLAKARGIWGKITYSENIKIDTILHSKTSIHDFAGSILKKARV